VYGQGVLEGEMRLYAMGYVLTTIIPFQNGKMEGMMTHFSDSVLQMKSTFSGGVQHGLTTVYHDNAQVSTEIMYQQGKMEGPFMCYTREGKLLQKSFYQQGELHGLSIMYKPDGTELKREVYEKGQLIDPKMAPAASPALSP